MNQDNKRQEKNTTRSHTWQKLRRLSLGRLCLHPSLLPYRRVVVRSIGVAMAMILGEALQRPKFESIRKLASSSKRGFSVVPWGRCRTLRVLFSRTFWGTVRVDRVDCWHQLDEILEQSGAYICTDTCRTVAGC